MILLYNDIADTMMIYYLDEHNFIFYEIYDVHRNEWFGPFTSVMPSLKYIRTFYSTSIIHDDGV